MARGQAHWEWVRTQKRRGVRATGGLRKSGPSGAEASASDLDPGLKCSGRERRYEAAAVREYQRQVALQARLAEAQSTPSKHMAQARPDVVPPSGLRARRDLPVAVLHDA